MQNYYYADRAVTFTSSACHMYCNVFRYYRKQPEAI